MEMKMKNGCREAAMIFELEHVEIVNRQSEIENRLGSGALGLWDGERGIWAHLDKAPNNRPRGKLPALAGSPFASGFSRMVAK